MILVPIIHKRKYEGEIPATYTENVKYREVIHIKCFGKRHVRHSIDPETNELDIIKESFSLKGWEDGHLFPVPEWTHKIIVDYLIDGELVTSTKYYCEGLDVMIDETDPYQRFDRRFNGKLYEKEKYLQKDQLVEYIRKQEKIVQEYKDLNICINDIPDMKLSEYIIEKYKTEDTSDWQKDYYVFNN